MQELTKITEELIKKMGYACDSIELREEAPHPIIAVRSSDAKALIGYKGEALQALNTIMRRIAERKGVEERVMVDINDYQGKRIEELKSQAKILAERARVFAHEVEMNPMNAYERMIVHSVLSEEEDLETESSGEGKFRRVVIKVKKT